MPTRTHREDREHPPDTHLAYEIAAALALVVVPVVALLVAALCVEAGRY